MSEPQSLDPAALSRLQRLGGEAFVRQMVTLFLEYAGAKITEARRALEARDFAAVERAVHPLKSSAGNVGASRVQDLALHLEGLAREGQAEPLNTAMAELEQAFAVVKTELLQKTRTRATAS